MSANEMTVAVVGLGYVGLPLAVAFGRQFRTLGYDLDAEKVEAYRRHVDPTGEVTTQELRAASGLECTSDPRRLAEADFVVVAVPTPVDAAHNPDLGPLVGAAEIVGRHMKTGATVIFESTVYPGATEEVCVPVLEKSSGMKWQAGFHVGYSPERINPGDREHTLARVVKVVSGDSPETLERVAALYGAVVEAGVHRASSIMVAEAAKVIENTQRDLNIALMNELALINARLGLDTGDVLAAARTKWNFLGFTPGLVGGHCIGVDPYYLTHKAQQVGYHPEVVLAGRRVNDGMGRYIGRECVRLLTRLGRQSPRVAVLGVTFKEDVPDVRNSKVFDVIDEVRSFGFEVTAHDPHADPAAAEAHGATLAPLDSLAPADAVIFAVAHKEFRNEGWALASRLLRNGGVVMDVRGFLDRARKPEGVTLWRL